jgi:lipid II:glycine glycyltransferase (peptidoglycan interpeptide bridge formation enzyme)
MLTFDTITDRAAWDDAVTAFPNAHLLQSWAWGEFKYVTTGWQPLRLAFKREEQTVAVISIGIRKAGPVTVMYAPKGPLFDVTNLSLATEVLDALESLARQYRAVALKIDPDIPLATGAPGEPDDAPNPSGMAWQTLLETRGWRYSSEQVQFKNTIVIDLTPDEDALLMRLSQNTRRKVRVAEREAVTIRAATESDVPMLYDLYVETGARDGFLVRPRAYYERAWRDFMRDGLCHPLIAEVDGLPVSHVVLYRFGQTAWYFYGASREIHREKMPNYLLQWEAMRWAKSHGCTRYDLWGAPDIFEDSDGMWGVYQFKRGFRGTVIRTGGAWDYAPNAFLYNAFTKALPRARAFIRRLRHGKS